MRRLGKLILISALLLAASASAELWHALGRRDLRSGRGVEAKGSPVRRFGDSKASSGGGSVVLKNLTLTKISGSAVLKGDVVNSTGRPMERATFEVKAYDREGRLLKGVEEKTIISVNRLDLNARAPINSGYGVWLQGIPPDRIARIEISETDDGAATTFAARTIPFAAHAVFWKEYSEIEE